MNTKIKKPFETLVSCNNDRFDFELWASLVKPQLLAALKKERRSFKKDTALSE
jgi:hypothetical protein